MEKNQNEALAVKVSTVSILVNLILSLIKLLAGVIGKSGAMISDAVHSASDVFSTFVVIIGVKMAGKQADEEHPYGHERMECAAAMILAMLLAAVGIGIGASGIQKIISGNYDSLTVPKRLTLFAAAISIAVKMDVLVHEIRREKNQFRRAYGGRMAPPFRLPLLHRLFPWNPMRKNGVSCNGPHCKRHNQPLHFKGRLRHL